MILPRRRRGRQAGRALGALGSEGFWPAASFFWDVSGIRPDPTVIGVSAPLTDESAANQERTES
jgi:hypothetical protein